MVAYLFLLGERFSELSSESLDHVHLGCFWDGLWPSFSES